jgi:cellobiose phosphorylase
MLHQPAYTHYYLNLGEISSYPPGYKENGSVFCHTNPWIMIAEAMLGNGAAAHDYYLRINPSKREEISEVHRCEPYVYAQTIAGREAATYGEAKNSWLTGTAAWNYLAITQWILGIRPEFEGLRIDPCIPPEWDGFRVERAFRGRQLQIMVHNPSHISHGVSRVELDGREIQGNLVRFTAEGDEHQVDVWMGS